MLLQAAIAAPDAQAADRYVAWLADGTKLTSPALSAWPVPGGGFRFENHDLLKASNPVRLVRDREARVSLSAPLLVMASGDILPGSLTRLEADGGRIGMTPRVRVELEPPLMPVTGTELSVRTDRIQRFVAASNSINEQPPPGTVVLADGRRLTARSIRWREYGLAILTAGGIVEAAFRDLADVVFPSVDVAAAVLDDNLWAGGASGPAIARFQTTSGAVVTAARVSREQEQARRRGRVTNATFYYVQPAWADQPLAIPEQEIVCCGYRAADEAPLSSFPAKTVVNLRLIGWAHPWAATRRLLAAADRESDFGIAAHAHSEIEFELPPAAKTLELCAGLDRAVGSGGCVRCQVLAETADAPNPLWDSGVIQGKDGVKATGPIDVRDIRRVKLKALFAHDERPPGADPFDIRDQVVWLAPLVKLDLEAGGLATRAAAVLPGVAEWQFDAASWRNVQIANRWNVPASTWDPVITLSKDSALKLTRKAHVTRASDVLELLTVCPLDLDEHDFTLKVNGEAVAWHNNADRNQLRQWTLRYSRTRAREGDEESNLTDRLAYWWDLSPWRGQDLELALTLRGGEERNEIAWRGLALRSAIGNLPADGQPPTAAVPLPEPMAKSGNPSRDDARLLGQPFKNAWLLPRGSSFSFPLKPDYRQFVAVVGCPQQVAGPVQVLIDDRLVWERASISSLSPAEQIEIAIPEGAKTLTLQTGADALYYGSAAFAEAGFLTK